MIANAAYAGSHTWDVNEVFSNADGTIQFIELWEANGTAGETGLPGHSLTSNTRNFVLPGGPLTPPTTHKFYLIATQSFADLPNAPTPDAIIPPGSIPFFSVAGDTVTYDPWDSLAFGAGLVPTDGIHSLGFDLSTGVNSPTNYAGQTGSVDASGGSMVPAASTWGLIALSGLILCVGTLLVQRRTLILSLVSAG